MDSHCRLFCLKLRKMDKVELRGCLKRSGCREPTQHQTRHGERIAFSDIVQIRLKLGELSWVPPL